MVIISFFSIYPLPVICKSLSDDSAYQIFLTDYILPLHDTGEGGEEGRLAFSVILLKTIQQYKQQKTAQPLRCMRSHPLPLQLNDPPKMVHRSTQVYFQVFRVKKSLTL